MIRIIGTLAGVGALTSAFLWWQWQSTGDDLDVAEKRVQAHRTAAERTRAAMDELQAERKRAAEAAEEARRQRDEIEREARAVRGEIRELEESDDEVESWSRRRVPGAVLDRVRGPGGGDGDADREGDSAE